MSLSKTQPYNGDEMVNASELTATITAIANYLTSQLTQDQLELLGG